ncbi:MAG: glutamate--tRNA ligase [Verrucomicrobia bacterium]|jgi:glutamyl-tRNA synthetase|nr:glutamate--tRNA ligase [Verrucomicrobiota bacterium]MBT7067894.1 glutamate--tRNA ligase [Verrucomicrobiota bacterium]MBT7699346.1 glutamate--tRNA ligase [Verrucomicrobiota bacterium]
MTVRVRFAPSPTGHVHIGNIRAAIFNWLFARHRGGEFLLRVEDTDLERSTDEAKETLREAMAWLKLDIDGEVMHQSQRRTAHLAAAGELEASGAAYALPSEAGKGAAVCFRMPWMADVYEPVGPAHLTVHPDVPVTISHAGVQYAMVSKKGKPVEESGCLAGFKGLRLFDADDHCLYDLGAQPDTVLAGKAEFTVEHVVRMEFERRQVVFEDLIKGRMTKPLDGIKDLVIVRSSGAPVFHLANVCDDAVQEITHIVRGDDHVENTFRHVLLFAALGHTPPVYAHLPMIVNAQGKPYSKRDGDAYVGDFKARGFDPDALFNYLTLLGWAPGDDREKLSREDLVSIFTLERVRSAPSQMDLKKLAHMNGLYLAELPLETFMASARTELAKHDWGREVDEKLFREVCALLQSRTQLYPDVAVWKYFFSDELEYDPKGVRKFLQKEGVVQMLTALRQRLADVDFEENAVESLIHEIERENEIKEGKLNQPIRVAVTATPIGAGLYETMVLLGRERVLTRLDYAIANLCDREEQSSP